MGPLDNRTQLYRGKGGVDLALSGHILPHVCCTFLAKLLAHETAVQLDCEQMVLWKGKMLLAEQ